MESTKEPDGESWTRHTIDATIPMQDLIDSYMVPFQSCVEKGKVTSLMCSCASASPLRSPRRSLFSLAEVPRVPADNAVNGNPSCANEWLLKDVARVHSIRKRDHRHTGSCAPVDHRAIDRSSPAIGREQ